MNDFIYVFFGIFWLVAPIVVMLVAGDHARKSIVPYSIFAKIIPATVGSFLIYFIFIAVKINWSGEFGFIGLFIILFFGQSVYFFISLFYSIHVYNKCIDIRAKTEQLDSKLVSIDDMQQMFSIIFFGLALIFTISIIVFICFPLIRGE